MTKRKLANPLREQHAVWLAQEAQAEQETEDGTRHIPKWRTGWKPK